MTSLNSFFDTKQILAEQLKTGQSLKVISFVVSLLC